MTRTRHRLIVWTRSRVLLIGLAALAVLFIVGASVWAQLGEQQAQDDKGVVEQQRDDAIEEKVTLAQQIKAECAAGDLSGPICQRAAEVAATPTVAPPSAAQIPEPLEGTPGRGITNTDVNDAGHLIVFYTDGTSEDVGQVVGREGATGPDGRGIADSDIVDGRLVLIYSDGERVDLGPVVGRDGVDGTNGRDGDDGEKGDPGRGVSSVDQVDGRLVVTYDDGTTQDAGPLPVADPPPPPSSLTLTINGTTQTCIRSGGTDAAPAYACSAPATEPDPGDQDGGGSIDPP